MKKGALFILLAAFLWGLLPVFSRLAYQMGSDPLTSAAWRAYLASAVFLVWFLAKGTFKTLRVREIPFYLLYGLTGVGGTFIFYMLAIERLSTAMAAMLLYTAPAFVILLSRVFYKEPITKVKLAALLLTFGGCFLVVRGYDIGSLRASLGGVAIGLLSGLSYSMVTVLGRKASRLHDSQTNAGLSMLFGALVFLFIRPPWQLAAPPLPLLANYLALALLSSVGAYCCYLYGMAQGIEGGVASLLATAEPVIATLLGALVFADTLEIWQALGVAVVLAGAGLPLLAARIAASRQKAGSPPKNKAFQ